MYCCQAFSQGPNRRPGCKKYLRIYFLQQRTRKNSKQAKTQNRAPKVKNTEDQKQKILYNTRQATRKNAGFWHRFAQTKNYDPTANYGSTGQYIEGGTEKIHR